MECSYIPSYIIFEILSRTSLQTLGKCRSVCKEWNLITYESNFIRQYCKKTKAISGYFIQSLSKNRYYSTFINMDQLNPGIQLSLDFLPGPVKIEASSNQGILFCLNQKPKHYRVPQYYVCKPTTKQWTQIPNPKTRYFTQRSAMIVLHSNPLLFKIVRFSSWYKERVPFKGYDYLQCEIFDSKAWAWKQLKKKVELPHCVSLSLEPAVSACGALHWLTDHKPCNRILAFHEDKEDWNVFPLPQEADMIDSYEQRLKLLEYEGKLALMCFQRKEQYMELWVMEDYRNKVWSKRRTLSLETITRQDRCNVPEAFCNEDIALIRGYFKVILYRFQDEKSTEVKLSMEHYQPRGFFPIQSDLETIDFRTNH